jgi:hypothetical protein
MVSPKIPTHLVDDFFMLSAEAHDEAYRARFMAFVCEFADYAANAEAHHRVDRYAGVHAAVERLARRPDPLDDKKLCLGLVAGTTELLMESGNAHPKRAEVAEALAALGCRQAEAVVAKVWDTPEFHVRWLRLLPARRPLTEAFGVKS